MGNVLALNFTIQLESAECYTCGVTFAVPTQLLRHAREDSTVSIYCPSGHGMHWRETVEDRLRKELAAKKAELERQTREAEFQRTLKEEAERRVSAQKAVTTKLRKRIGAGVCPCCHRTFSQLAAHMKAKHPEVATESAE